jgi:hypothetical protein
MVIESSQMLVARLQKLSNVAIPTATSDLNGIIDKKMKSMQKNMMEKINEKLLINCNISNRYATSFGEQERLDWF